LFSAASGRELRFSFGDFIFLRYNEKTFEISSRKNGNDVDATG